MKARCNAWLLFFEIYDRILCEKRGMILERNFQKPQKIKRVKSLIYAKK